MLGRVSRSLHRVQASVPAPAPVSARPHCRHLSAESPAAETADVANVSVGHTSLSDRQLQRYHSKIFANILASKFVYRNLQEFPADNLTVSIKVMKKKLKSTHYLYLFLLTNERPFLRKFKSGARHGQGGPAMGSKATLSREMFVELKNGEVYPVLSKMLFDVLPEQFINEKSVITVNQQKISVNVLNAVLFKEAEKLKSANNYIDDFGLTVEFKLPTRSFYEKIFILRHLGLIENEQHVDNLDYNQSEQ